MPEEQKPNPRRTITPALALVFLLFLAGIGAALIIALSGSEAPVQRPVIINRPATGSLINQPAPDFALEDLNGEILQLSDLRGRVVFLNFWATWCVPCRREMPAFERFMKDQPDAGPIVIAVNQDESADEIRDFLDDIDVSGVPVVLDPGAAVHATYSIVGMPTTYIIDETGVIRAVKFGEVTAEDFAAYLASLQ